MVFLDDFAIFGGGGGQSTNSTSMLNEGHSSRMSTDEEASRSDWLAHRGFKMAKLFPADTESGVAELYFGELVWAYVSLQGIDEMAVGAERVANAHVVVEFWREPDTATGVWDFNLELVGVLELLGQARAWLLENESGRAAAESDSITAAGSAFEKMSQQQRRQASNDL